MKQPFLNFAVHTVALERTKIGGKTIFPMANDKGVYVIKAVKGEAGLRQYVFDNNPDKKLNLGDVLNILAKEYEVIFARTN